MVRVLSDLSETEKGFGAFRKITLQDDGFLPDGVISPWRYFVQRGSALPEEDRPLFADYLPVPELWEIMNCFDRAEIWDEGVKKAVVEYAGLTEYSNVKAVRWLLPDGTIYKVDHYDRYGSLYFSEILDKDGGVNIRTYYAGGSEPVLFCQPKRNRYILMERSRIVRVFDSPFAVLAYFIGCVFPAGTAMVSDDSREASELNVRGVACRHGDRFEMEFPENPCGGDAYVLTNTDQVEQLEYLIISLPQLHFHVAAITIMSDNLMRLGEYPNVSLHPGISEEKREELLKSCTYYLDINHYMEICDAVYEAYRHNLLIVGFVETLHHAAYVLPQCAFTVEEKDKMAELLKVTWEDKALLKDLTGEQSRWPLRGIFSGKDGG